MVSPFTWSVMVVKYLSPWCPSGRAVTVHSAACRIQENIVFSRATAQIGPRPPFLRFLDHTQTRELLRTTDQLVAETATYRTHNKQKRRTSMTSAGFEPSISAIELLQIYAIFLNSLLCQLFYNSSLSSEVSLQWYTQILWSCVMILICVIHLLIYHVLIGRLISRYWLTW